MQGAEVPLVATARFAYVRFHGGPRKYSGDYPERALRDWADRLRRLARDVPEVYVYFNNDIGGHAVRNAQTLTDMLGRSAVRPRVAHQDLARSA
jgi:uncharacterized protein YecE (DUF72 family)